MPRINYSFTAILDADPGGDNIVAGQSVTVNNELDSSIATIYSDSSGTPLSNPTVTDVNGVLSFWVDPGIYEIVSGARTEIEWIDDGSRLIFETTAAATATKQIRDGERVTIKERNNAEFDVETGVSGADTYSVIANDAGTSKLTLVQREIFIATEFGAVGDNSNDDTGALQAFLDASKGSRGYIPAGKYKITFALIFDPTSFYWIEGAGYDPNGGTTTTINNQGVGHALFLENLGTNVDNLIVIRGMTIFGTQSSQNGIYAKNVHGLRLEKLWISTNGNHGVQFFDCWACECRDLVIAQNGQHGLFMDSRNNNVLIEHCTIAGNSRSDGFTNVTLSGGSGTENLGVIFHNCDFSAAGANPYTTVTTAFGLVVNNTFGLTITGCYAELVVTQLFNMGANVKAWDMSGNYWQDGIVELTAAEDGAIESDDFVDISAVTSGLIVTGSSTSLVRVGINSFRSGATETLNGGALKRTTIGVPMFTLREGTTPFDVGNAAANGGLLASDTTPVLEAINGATDGCQRISWVASNNDQLIAQLAIPSDIDVSYDLEVHFRILSSGVTDAVGFLVTSFFNEGDTSIADNTTTNGTSGYLDVFATIAAADLPTNPTTMTFGFTPIAHTTDTLKMSAVWVEYVSLRRTN